VTCSDEGRDSTPPLDFVPAVVPVKIGAAGKMDHRYSSAAEAHRDGRRVCGWRFGDKASWNDVKRVRFAELDRKILQELQGFQVDDRTLSDRSYRRATGALEIRASIHGCGGSCSRQATQSRSLPDYRAAIHPGPMIARQATRLGPNLETNVLKKIVECSTLCS
jgi:hypothetical protein